MHQRTKAAVLFTLGAAFLVAMLAHYGIGQVVDAITRASPVHLGLAVVTYAAFFLVRAVRWKLLFSHSAPDVRVSSAAGITAIGWFANSVLPLKGGEVLRAALMAKREQVGLATSASTVALERVLDMVGLATLAAVALLLIPRATQLPPGIERALAIVWVLPILALVVLAALVRYRERVLALVARGMRPFGRVGQKLASFTDTLVSGLAALAQRPRLLAKLLPLTIVVAILQSLIFTFLAVAFMPTLPVAAAFTGSAIFLLSFVVSVTPGNVGTYEAAFVAVFVALGSTPEVALPAALLSHVVTTLTVALLAGVALIGLGLESSQMPWRLPRATRATQGGGLP